MKEKERERAAQQLTKIKNKEERERRRKKDGKGKTKCGRKREKGKSLLDAVAQMNLSDTCPVCHRTENDSDEGSRWICCDNYDQWYHFDCVDLLGNVPDVFVCDMC